MTQTTTTTAADRLLRPSPPRHAGRRRLRRPRVFDATVPGWRFAVRTREAIGYQFAEWSREPATFDELERHVTPTGEVVEYTIAWEEDGVPHAAHHVHVLTDRSRDQPDHHRSHVVRRALAGTASRADGGGPR